MSHPQVEIHPNHTYYRFNDMTSLIFYIKRLFLTEIPYICIR